MRIADPSAHVEEKSASASRLIFTLWRVSTGMASMNSKEFVALLKEHDLYPELTPSYDHVDGAWVPSSLVKSLYARRRDTPVEAPKM